MKYLLMLSIMAGGGCPAGDITFHSEATYRAVKTGYEITIIADGLIKDEADIANIEDNALGAVSIRAISDHPIRKPIAFQVSHEQYLVCQIGGGASFPIEWDFQTRERIFTGLLRKAGYELIDTDEINESLKAMYGVMYGPKATYLKGQTEYIEVVSFEREYDL